MRSLKDSKPTRQHQEIAVKRSHHQTLTANAALREQQTLNINLPFLML
jgi:hypothetical protein